MVEVVRKKRKEKKLNNRSEEDSGKIENLE